MQPHINCPRVMLLLSPGSRESDYLVDSRTPINKCFSKGIFLVQSVVNHRAMSCTFEMWIASLYLLSDLKKPVLKAKSTSILPSQS